MLFIMVLSGSKTHGYFEVFAKQGQPPGWHYSQYDFRPAYQYYQVDDEEKDLEIKFDVQSIGFQTGTPWHELPALSPLLQCGARQGDAEYVRSCHITGYSSFLC